MGIDYKSLEKRRDWPVVCQVINSLHKKNFQAFLAGGCVRDLLLGRVPNDFDVATDADPENVEAIFAKTVDVGKVFGTIIVILQGIEIEVTRFRKDSQYTDGRHPDGVEFSNAREDAARRDFTINSMFLDIKKKQVIDYFGGQEDLKRRVIRTVGIPAERFAEDKLRILRALRFVAQLGFKIEETTLTEIKKRASEIKLVSKERIQEEIKKILTAPHRIEGLNKLVDTGIFPEIFVGFSFYKTKWKLFLLANEEITLTDFITRLSLICYFEMQYGTGLDTVDTWLREMKFSKDIYRNIISILKGLEVLDKESFFAQAQQIEKLYGLNLIELWRVRAILEKKNLSHIEATLARFTSICDRQGRLPVNYLNGEDLLGLGVHSGPKLGELLAAVYEQQIEGGIQSKTEALDWICKKIKDDTSREV